MLGWAGLAGWLAEVEQNQLYFSCLEGSGRLDVSYSTYQTPQDRRTEAGLGWLAGWLAGWLNVSYCTRLEAQHVDKFIPGGPASNESKAPGGSA